MEVVRKTKSRCHKCAKEVDGLVVVDEGEAYLFRECPDHGSYRYLLSHHGKDYADLDRFYTDIYETAPLGRTMHTWVMATLECQQKCPYCSADCGNEIQESRYEDMNWDDLKGILERFKHGKISFSGGEPTLHPNVMEFFREADRRGVAVQLATNGLLLVSKEYCQKLKDAKVKEVRLSMEGIHKEAAAELELDAYVEPKLAAIKNCGEVGIPVTLSPTIFKGVNEEELYHILEYSKDKPFIKALSVTGFSWNGCGIRMPQDMMIAPDEMMDTIHKHYFKGSRSDIFAFQKLMFAVLNVMGFKLCLKSEFMIFLRENNHLTPLTELINVPRMDKMLNWWRRVIPRQRWMRGLMLVPVLAAGISLKTIPYSPMFIRLLLANLVKLKVHAYPPRLLALALNTNCSTLNADRTVGNNCVSGVIYKRNGELVEMNASSGLLEKEEANCQSGFWDKIRSSNVWKGKKGA